MKKWKNKGIVEETGVTSRYLRLGEAESRMIVVQIPDYDLPKSRRKTRKPVSERVFRRLNRPRKDLFAAAVPDRS